MKSKDAVVFACWFSVPERCNQYIDAMRNNFPNEDVYFGINPSSSNYHKTLPLLGYENIELVNENQVVNSDASAYQAALKNLRNSGKEYDNIYFIHTKAMSYPQEQIWFSSYDSYYLGFFRQLQTIRNILDTETNVGGVSYVGRNEPMNDSGYSKALDKYMKFPTDNVENIMSLLTFYTIRGNIVNKFLKNTSEDFFTDTLDRYFFETSFPLIVDKMGYKRHHLVMW